MRDGPVVGLPAKGSRRPTEPLDPAVAPWPATWPIVKLAGAYAAGFCVLFTQIAMFTYVTFHLADPPFNLSPAALGWLFSVYLAGAVITPFAGRWIDVYGHRAGLVAAIAIGVTGSLFTLSSALALVVAGLAFVSSGVFIAQAAASSYVGASARRDRGLAVGLYIDVLLRGRERRRRAAIAVLDERRLAGMRRIGRRCAVDDRHDRLAVLEAPANG